MRRLALAALALAAAGALTGPATPSDHTPQIACKYGFKFVVKVVRGHRKRVKVCKPKPRPKPKADLSIKIAPSPAHVTAGNLIVYRIDVSNLGAVPAAQAELSVRFPEGSEYAFPLVSPFRGFPQCEGRGNAEDGPFTWTCKLGTVRLTTEEGPDGPGNPPTRMLFTAGPSAAGPFSVTAEVTSSTADARTGNNRATAVTDVSPGPASADLEVTLSVAPDPVSVADDFVETLTVTNHGPTEASFVTVPVLFPVGADLVDLEGLTFSDACPILSGSATSITLCWESLAAGETAVVKITLTPTMLAPPVLPASAVVSSGLTRDPNLANNRADASAARAPFNPVPGVDLVASFGTPEVVSSFGGPEADVSFRIVNLGAETARNVHFVIRVAPPLTTGSSGFALQGAEEVRCSGGGDNSLLADCLVGELESGGRMSGEISLAPEPPAAESLTMSVDSSVQDANPSDNTAEVNLPAVQRRARR